MTATVGSTAGGDPATGPAPAPASDPTGGTAPARGTDTSARRFEGLDGLRAVAAFMIVVHHAAFQSGVTFRPTFGPFTGRLDVGVPIFFVLSGFVLFRPFVVRLFDGDARPGGRLAWRSFYLRRVLRIFPAYWAALLVQLAFGAIVVGGVTGFLWYATLTQVLTERKVIGGIVQAWSLSTELGFYLVLPAGAALAFRRLRGRSVNHQALGLLAALAVVGLSSFVFRLAMHLAAPSWEGLAKFWAPSFAEMFALGMGLAVLSAWAERRRVAAELCASLARRTWLCWALAAVVFWWTSSQLGLAVGLDTAGFGREMIRQSAYAVIGLLVVMPVALGDDRSGLGRRVLASRPLVWLGGVSYGVYLWHVAFQVWIQRWFGWGVFEGRFWPILVGSTVLAILAGWVSLVVVERPAQRLAGRR